jgi:hypothetical protein
MSTERNVYQRIMEIRKKVAYIRKDKRVGDGGYMVVTHDSVTSETRDAFIEHGVLITPPSLISSAVAQTGTFTKNQIPFIRYEAKYRFEAVNVDDPSDRFSFDIEAHAIDQGDKAPGKALSYSKKYAILKLLEIESGEEEEERAEQHKPPEAKSVSREVFEGMTQVQKKKLTDISILLIDYLNEGEDQKAFEYYTEQKEKLDTDEQVALWSRLDSKQRSTIKTLGEAHKKSEAARRNVKAV